MSIENPILVHFRHFSSLLNNVNRVSGIEYQVSNYELRILTYEIINLFLQNEPNFRKSQVNVSDLLTMEYEQMDTWSIRKNEPKTNPNEPNSKPISANEMPKRTQYKPKQTQFITAWPEKRQFQKGYLLVKCIMDNYLPLALFPLTSCPAGRYNSACSKISFLEKNQLKGYGNE